MMATFDQVAHIRSYQQQNWLLKAEQKQQRNRLMQSRSCDLDLDCREVPTSFEEKTQQERKPERKLLKKGKSLVAAEFTNLHFLHQLKNAKNVSFSVIEMIKQTLVDRVVMIGVEQSDWNSECESQWCVDLPENHPRLNAPKFLMECFKETNDLRIPRQGVWRAT